MNRLGILLLGVSLFLISCNSGYRAPYGFFLQETKYNHDIISQTDGLGKKVGEACIEAYLMLISKGDASIKAATHNAPNGGITKIYAIDYRKEQFLGFVQQKLCTIVYGD